MNTISSTGINLLN